APSCAASGSDSCDCRQRVAVGFSLLSARSVAMMPLTMRGLGILLVVVAACGHDAGSGASPDANEGVAPSPDAWQPIPIKHVVVVVKENHTFDNYFGSFPGAEGISQIVTPHGTITPPRAPDRTPRDMCHEHQ